MQSSCRVQNTESRRNEDLEFQTSQDLRRAAPVEGYLMAGKVRLNHMPACI